MKNNGQDFNNCKHHNVGRYNCWVGWPLRCILETKSKKHCEHFEPKEEKVVESQKSKQETTTTKCRFFRRRNLLQLRQPRETQRSLHLEKRWQPVLSFLQTKETKLNNMKLQPIHKEVVSLLQAFGYKPEVKTYHVSRRFKTIVEISFPVNNGFETMPTRHKDAITMLVKGYLSEFYYGQDTQYIRLYYDCEGLNPDDSRYACLLHELRLVNSEHPCKPGTEVFVNMGDHFKHLVNWTDVTSID